MFRELAEEEPCFRKLREFCFCDRAPHRRDDGKEKRARPANAEHVQVVGDVFRVIREIRELDEADGFFGSHDLPDIFRFFGISPPVGHAADKRKLAYAKKRSDLVFGSVGIFKQIVAERGK